MRKIIQLSNAFDPYNYQFITFLISVNIFHKFFSLVFLFFLFSLMFVAIPYEIRVSYLISNEFCTRSINILLSTNDNVYRSKYISGSKMMQNNLWRSIISVKYVLGFEMKI